MKRAIVFFSLVTVGLAATFETGLRATVSYGLNVGKDFFFDLPRYKDNATAMGWSQMERPPSPLPELVMFCPKECTLCVMYDNDTGYVAAIQVALPMNEFTGATFDWTIQGFIPWKTHVVGNDTQSFTYMTKQLYLISEDTLKKSKEERLKAAKEGKILQEDKVWPVGFHQKRMAVSTNVTGILKDGFTKQNCFLWMGTHYFFNMTTETECKADTLLNWFLLVDGDDLIGMALTVIGKVSQKDGETFYFERPSKTITLAIIKHCPQCLADLLEDPTSTTMHIYFIDKPWTVGCIPTIF